MKEKTTVYVITGPTASGKSALAVELALKLNTEVISADSRQVYRGIPIATAVPSEEERKGIRHHILEQLDLTDYYSASLFEKEALKIVESLLEERGSAVLCGGSMLYVDTFCNGIDPLPTVSEELRNSLMEDWKNRGDDWVRGMLKNLDPGYWIKVDQRNLKRIFHAVEISLTAGKPYSELISGVKKPRPFNIRKFCITGERNDLFNRINNRVEIMLSRGLEEEARSHYGRRNLNSLNTVGLKEMFDYFDGKYTLEEAKLKIQKNTRVYAKKQMTWYKKDSGLSFVDMNNPDSYKLSFILGS